MARRAIEVIEHPLMRRNYRVATAAIESFVDLVERCLRVLIPGALVYARPRMGKTHAIDYVCLHLARREVKRKCHCTDIAEIPRKWLFSPRVVAHLRVPIRQ